MAASPADLNTYSVDAVYDWANKLTAESRGLTWTIQDYYWPPVIKDLSRRLTKSQRELIAVVGCQGVGKTSAMQALEHDLEFDFEAAVMIVLENKYKMSSSKPQVMALNYSDLERFLDLQDSEAFRLSGIMQSYIEELNHLARLQRMGDHYGGTLPVEDAEVILGKGRCRQARMTSILKTLPSYRYVLIDFPDYSRTDRRRMVGDLEQVQTLWRSVMADPNAKTNFILFLQEETFRGHFFFGKMDTITIKPLTPQELLSIYTRKFKTFYPFTEDALTYLAKLGHGVFRRFLQYIKLSLDKWNETKDHTTLIDKNLAKMAVSRERLIQDMDVELFRLFPKNMEAKSTAVEILNLLEENKNMNQRAIAEQLDIPDYKLSRIIKKLESGHQVQREKVGLDKVVRLAEPV